MRNFMKEGNCRRKRFLRHGIFLTTALVLVLWWAPHVSAEKSPHPAWQEEWEKTVSAAKREGTLLIYTTHGSETRTELARSFKNKFGINIEFVAGRGGEMATRISAERRAGLYTGDLYIGGSTPQVADFKPNGVLAPLKPLLILPEVMDANAYFDNEMPWVDNEKMYILTYGLGVLNSIAVNADLVKAGEIKGYVDLLNPRWKDKIIILDPTMPGTGQVWFFVTAMFNMTPDFHRRLIRQNPMLTRDSRLQVEWVAKRKYPVALAPAGQRVGEFQEAGAPIKWVPPAEGSYLAPAGSVSYFDRAPHPNAAKVFVNWLFTKEGLTTWSKAAVYQTTRKDVPNDFLLPEVRRDPKVKYFNTAKEDIRSKIRIAAKLAKEIYGPSLKKSK